MMEKKTNASREKEIYAAPGVAVLAFVLEKGFAGSSPTLHSVGDPSAADYAGEKMDEVNWNLTDDNHISF